MRKATLLLLLLGLTLTFSPQPAASSLFPQCEWVCPDWWDACRCGSVIVLDCSGCSLGFGVNQTSSEQPLCAPADQAPNMKAPAQPAPEGAADVGSDT
jgi:hypothetical protein